MIFSMTGQDKDDLLIEVTTWAGLTVYTIQNINSGLVIQSAQVKYCFGRDNFASSWVQNEV